MIAASAEVTRIGKGPKRTYRKRAVALLQSRSIKYASLVKLQRKLGINKMR